MAGVDGPCGVGAGCLGGVSGHGRQAVAGKGAGHLAALEYCRDHVGMETVNLGTGRPRSVREIIRAYEQVNGVTVPAQRAAVVR